MALPNPFSSAESETNGYRTAFMKRITSQFPRRHYMMAKAQLEARKILHTITKDKWQRIADELADVLLQGWDKKTREGINEAIGQIRGGDDFSEEDLGRMMAELRKRLGSQFADDVAQPLMEVQTGAYREGMEEIIEQRASFKTIDTQALNWLEENHMYWVRGYYDRQFQEQIAEAGQDVITQGLSRRDAAEYFRDKLGGEVSSQSFRYWEGFANHVTTRAREFGRVEGYVRAGVTHIEIDAVLDHRTSTICRHMNGRVISVEDAVNLRTQMMNAKSPADAIEIAPFMKPDDVLGTPTSELGNDNPGFALPPYHYDCRTRTRKSRTISEENTVTETTQGQNLSNDDREILTDLTEQEHSNVLETIRKKSQLSYSSEDFADDWETHASAFPDIDTKKAYRMGATKNMKAADRITAHVYNGEKQYRFFGPDGVTVVDGGAQVRGFYYHGSDEALDSAFNAMKKESILLNTSSE